MSLVLQTRAKRAQGGRARHGPREEAQDGEPNEREDDGQHEPADDDGDGALGEVGDVALQGAAAGADEAGEGRLGAAPVLRRRLRDRRGAPAGEEKKQQSEAAMNAAAAAPGSGEQVELLFV